MDDTFRELVSFHLTEDMSAGGLDAVAGTALRPALFAGFADLARLRHDYPLVLVAGDGGDDVVHSLSGIVDGVLREIAPPGPKGERLRKHVLGLEDGIRALSFGGTAGTLGELWDAAADAMLNRAGAAAREALEDSLARARAVVQLDGEVIACDAATPAKLLHHAWRAVEADKAAAFRVRLSDLVLRLSDILRADFMRSDQAHAPEHLEASVGTSYQAAFDFDAMSRILPKAATRERLPEARRRRIEAALAVLEGQRFVARPGPRGAGEERQPHDFVFDGCEAALEAFRERLGEMVDVVKAISIAELEIDNHYRESKHDPLFAAMDEEDLTPEDLEQFPSYLVCLGNAREGAAGRGDLIDLLSSGLSVRVLVEDDDVLEPAAGASGPLFSGAGGAHLASMAMGLNSAFVLQASVSHLYRMSEALLDGLRFSGPALFSVFSGAPGESAALPPYLLAAAAMESRAFPAFSYDPGAGADWASRFRVHDNPQPERDWPRHVFAYEDEELQRVSEDVDFTFVDFAACDRRVARHLAAVPRAKWHDRMVPVSTYLDAEPHGVPERVPYILMIDEDNALQRVVVGERLIHAARRCREMWRSLQELGGINNSHARRLLEAEREAWERDKERELEALKEGPAAPAATPAPAASAEAAPAAAAAVAEAAPEAVAEPEEEAAAPPSDEPYIETPRCTTCNECTQINNRMFAYDDNQQAYIADPDAGSYRELVEAAELCQVCIIHPGKPRNPDEPGLDELIKRAEPFN